MIKENKKDRITGNITFTDNEGNIIMSIDLMSKEIARYRDIKLMVFAMTMNNANNIAMYFTAKHKDIKGEFIFSGNISDDKSMNEVFAKQDEFFKLVNQVVGYEAE